MIRLHYVLYVAGLLFVLLFAANCRCGKDPVDPQHYWVICSDEFQTTPGGRPEPVLTNGSDLHLRGQLFNPTQYSCPNTDGSPIWTGSGQPIYNTNGIPKPEVRFFGPRALGPGQGAYLPQLQRDLPFPAQSSGAPNTAVNCSPSQPDVIQVNHLNASVNRIGTCPFQVKATIPVAANPLQIAITPDGATALVTSFYNAVNFINLATNQVIFTLPTGSIYPNGIAITPDGAFAYITNFVPTSDASISKIDLNSRTIVQTFAARAPYPQNLVLSPDGSQLVVTYPYNNVVQFIDTLTNSEIFALSAQGPRGVAFNSKGTKAYIAIAGNPDNATMSSVEEFDTNTFQVTATYQVGLGPNDVAVLYGDQFVVTSNYEGKSISKIDTVAGTVQTTPTNARTSSLSIVQ